MSLELKNPNEYADLQPVPCDQKPELPIYIVYDEVYDQLMSLFRALMERMELSQRALDLTTTLCPVCTSNQTLWWYRERILEHCGYSHDDEWAFLNKILRAKLKPYQLWNHRVWLMKRYAGEKDESDLHVIIDRDVRNLHAWSYANWFADTFKKYEWLDSLTSRFISTEPLNNSAWASRWRLVSGGHLSVTDELSAALDKLGKFPDVEAIYNFVRGIVQLGCGEQGIACITTALDAILNEDDTNKHAHALLSYIAWVSGNIEEYETRV
jgi:protein farnesyltransferase/geranylgeranyltransferase type-1 subunit alpha